MPSKKQDRMARKRAALAHAASALSDATDDAGVVEDILVLMHLAGAALEPATAGAVSSGAMIARQHMASLRDNLHAARRELATLRHKGRPEEHST